MAESPKYYKLLKQMENKFSNLVPPTPEEMAITDEKISHNYGKKSREYTESRKESLQRLSDNPQKLDRYMHVSDSIKKEQSGRKRYFP